MRIDKPLPGTQLNHSHPLSRGLVAFYLFNEQSGMQTFDVSPYKNHGTLNGFNDPSSKDRDSQGLQFDGNNDYIDCGNNNSLAISGDLTIVAYIKRKVTGAFHTIIDKEYSKEYLIRISNTNKLQIYQGDGIFELVADNKNIGTEWTHCAITRNAEKKEIIFYVNEKINSTHTYIKTVIAGTNKVEIGHRHDFPPNWQYFNGLMGEVKIYNRALSADEYKHLYINPYCMFEQNEL